jgi:hypothetical protein
MPERAWCKVESCVFDCYAIPDFELPIRGVLISCA